MSYVTPGNPLPPNNQNPLSACEAQYARQIVNGVEQAAATGQATIAQMAPVSTFVALGLPVAVQVQNSQARIAAANQPGSAVNVGSGGVRSRGPAPRMIPLNITESEYNGCCIRGMDVLPPVQVSQPPRVSIQAAPVAMETSAGTVYLKSGAAPFMPYSSKTGRRRFNAGLGAAWGNAGSVPCGGTWPASGGGGGWLLLLAALGIGAYAWGKGR